jgi:hypothetical protein
MVLAAGVSRLVARDPGAEVDPLHQPFGGQQVEDAIDARDPDPAAGGPQPVEDLLRGQTAVLLREEVDHRPPGAAVPKPLPLQRLERRVSPHASR